MNISGGLDFGEAFANFVTNGQFAQAKDGQIGGGIFNKVMLIVAVPILIVIGLIVYAKFEGTVNHGSITTDASDAINTTSTNTYSGFNLAAVLPIVIAAVAILSIVMSVFAFRR